MLLLGHSQRQIIGTQSKPGHNQAYQTRASRPLGLIIIYLKKKKTPIINRRVNPYK